MPPVLHFLTHSEAGHNHINEDVVSACPHPQDANVLLCVLADGQGGQSGGGEASHRAVKACLNAASACSVQHLLMEDTWHEIVATVDEGETPSALQARQCVDR